MSELENYNLEDTEDTEPVAKQNETKAEKFQRLGSYRVTKALKAIDAIGNLSNTASYEYSPEMVEKMFVAIENKVAETKGKFEKTTKSDDVFSF